MITNLNLIYVLILALFCMTAIIRYFEKSWFTPSALFALIWTFIIPFSVLTAPDYRFSHIAIAFIAVSVFVFFVGSFLATHIFTSKIQVTEFFLSNFARRLLVVYLLIAIAAGFSAYFLLLDFGGISFENYFSIDILLKAADDFTRHRYEGVRLPGILMFLLMIAYSGCLVGGFTFSVDKSVGIKVLSLLVMLPILFFTIIYTARSVFLYAAVQFLSTSLLAGILQRGLSLKLFNPKNVFLFAGAVVSIIGIFFFGQVARAGSMNMSQDMYIGIAKHLKVWFSGNVSGFSIWFTQPGFDNHALMWGTQTFAGFAEWIGLNYREVGIYTMSFDVNGEQDFSNIYTYFRFLIDDFGLILSLVVLFATGFFSKILFINVLHKRITSLAILAGLVSIILFSFIASVMAYNTVFFSWLLFVFFIYLIEKINGYRQ